MKKKLLKTILGMTLVFSLVLLIAIGSMKYWPTSPQDSKSAPDVKVEVTPSSHDFGDIVQSDGPVSTVFTVKNSGTKPLVINRLSTSCGCTTAKMNQSPLHPGESRKMTVTFDPMVHPDQFGIIERVVYLQTTDPDRPEVEIDITGNVIK